MRALIMLYIKELKSIRDICIALCVLIFSALLVAQIGETLYRYRLPNLKYYNYLYLLTSEGYVFEHAGPYILSVLLGYRFFIEKKTKTDYLLLSLPVHRGFVIAGKLFAVLSYAFLLSFGTALIFPLLVVFHYSILQHTLRASHYPQYSIDWKQINLIRGFWISISGYFIMLSMTTVAIGVMHLVKSQRILIAVGVFILLDLITRFTLSFPGPSSIYLLIEGIIFSLVGIYLYQRYADV